MAITIDVLTQLDERSLATAARTLESRLNEIGGASGRGSKALEGLTKAQDAAAKSSEALAAAQAKMAEATSRHDALFAQQAGYHKQVRDAMAEHERALQSLSNTQQQYFSSLATGAAKGLAAVTGLAAGTFAALAGIGEQFEGINRQIVVSTGAMGPALDALNNTARDVMATVDTSTKSIGSDIGVLANRLHLIGDDPALKTLATHVSELRERFSGLDIRTLTGDFLQFGVAGKDADNVLASLMNTSMATAVPLNELLTTTQQFGETLQQAGLNIEQSARLVGQMDTILGPGGATKSMTGFAKAEADAAKEGVTLQQFLVEAAGHIETFMRVGDQAQAQDLMQNIFGTRNWPQAQAILKSYTDILHQGSDAWKAQGSDIDDVAKRTKTLGNYWDEVRNKISSALAAPGTSAIDVVGQNMEKLVSWVDAHQTDLRDFFQNAVDAIGVVVKGLGDVAAFLGRHPALIYAVAAAFATWKTIEGIAAVVTALRTISTLMATNIPASAVTAETAVAASGAGMLSALGPVAALLGTIATLWPQIKADFGAGMKQDGSLDWGKILLGNGPGGWVDEHILGQKPSAPTPASSSGPGRTDFSKGPFGGSGIQGGDPNQFGGAAVPGALPSAPPSGAFGGAGVLGQPGSGPQAPTPGNPAPVPAAGGDGDLGDAQAFLDSLKPGHKGGKGHKEPKGPRLPVAPEVPYGPEFTAPPLPGESESHFSDRGNVMQAQHKLAEDQARLNQLQHSNNATEEDLQKARNKIDEDIRSEQEARKRLQENELNSTKQHQKKLGEAADGFEQIGAKIDQDFGVSKGLPGIAENLFKFLADLVAAPIVGAAQGFNATQGGPTFGAKGLLGAAALGGAFGQQFTPQAIEASSGASGGSTGGIGEGSFSISGLTSGITSGISSPADLARAGGRTQALLALAQSLQGTPYSQAIRNDCSGIVSELASTAVGLPIPSASERFSTPNEGAWLKSHGFQMGTPPPGMGGSSLQIGWNPAPGNSGHTAATLPGGINAEQGGSNSSFTLGPKAAGANNPEFPLHAWLPMGAMPGYAAGGDIKGQGAIPIMAHEGEHMLTKADVQALGGHDGVYQMRASLHQSPTMQYLQDSASDKAGPQSPIPKEKGPNILPPGVMKAMPNIVQGGAKPGPSVIGTTAPPTGYGEGFAITGGGLIGIAESLPSMAASAAAFGMGETGGDISKLLGGVPGGKTPALGPVNLGPSGKDTVPAWLSPGEHVLTQQDVAAMGGQSGVEAFRSQLHMDVGGPVPPQPAAPAPPPAMPAPPPTPPPAAGPPGGSSGGGAKASGGSPAGSMSSALIGIGIQEMNAAIGASAQAVGAGVSGLLQTFGPGQFAQSKLAQSGWVNKVLGGITGAQPQLPNTAGAKHQSGTLTPEQAASAAGGTAPAGAAQMSGASNQGGGGMTNGVYIENYQVQSTEHRAGKELAESYNAHTNALTGTR